MIHEALEILKDNCTEKRLTVTVDIPEEVVLLADREMLQFVYRNLLHNAIKFSPAGSELSISYSIAGDYVTVAVTDQGRGVDPEMLPHLFEYRNREKGSGKSKGGAGLALIICKDFMDKMGGVIRGVNNAEKGSTFSYTYRW